MYAKKYGGNFTRIVSDYISDELVFEFTNACVFYLKNKNVNKILNVLYNNQLIFVV